jgi:hypothetical protein
MSDDSRPGKGQCDASVQLPDGSRLYCQKRLSHKASSDAKKQRHRWAPRAFEWSGSAPEDSSFCGFKACPGGDETRTPTEAAGHV